MPKQYTKVEAYEAKLARVMERLEIKEFNHDWSRFEAWVQFTYKGQPYRFWHSVDSAKAHGVNIARGEDAFAQIVLALEDLARMVNRGIYDLSTWVAGMKYLPTAVDAPNCFRVLLFDRIPASVEDVEKQYKQLVKSAHPDAGGTEEQFRVLQEARKQATAYFAGRNG